VKFPEGNRAVINDLEAYLESRKRRKFYTLVFESKAGVFPRRPFEVSSETLTQWRRGIGWTAEIVWDGKF
jgi:hypothetical protein